MKKQRRRSSYLNVPVTIELARTPITIWGYDKAGKFVCRLEINGAGVEVFAGGKAGKHLGNMTWEQLVARLEEPD